MRIMEVMRHCHLSSVIYSFWWRLVWEPMEPPKHQEKSCVKQADFEPHELGAHMQGFVCHLRFKKRETCMQP